MSFLSAFHKTAHAIEAATTVLAPLTPFISLIPGIGPLASLLINEMVHLEQVIATPGAGADKKAIVLQIVKAAFPHVDPAKVGPKIDGLVDIFNVLEEMSAPPPATAEAK